MAKFKTTQPIMSLSQNGVNLGANQPVSPAAFTSQRWDRLIEQGVVVEVLPSQPNQPILPERVKPQPTHQDLSGLTLAELKEKANGLGIEYPKSIRKAALIKRLEDAK